MHRIRLLLLDDHILFRAGLRRLLVSEPEFVTVAAHGTPREALDVVSRLPVDVVLRDFDLEDDLPGTVFVAPVCYEKQLEWAVPSNLIELTNRRTETLFGTTGQIERKEGKFAVSRLGIVLTLVALAAMAACRQH